MNLLTRRYQHYFKRLLVRKLQHEKWSLDQCRHYAARLACELELPGAAGVTRDLSLRDVDHHKDRRRPGPDDIHLAAPRDMAVPWLQLDAAALGRCREALGEAGGL